MTDYMYDMTDSYVWHDWSIRAWYGSFICVTWLIHMRVIWPIHTRDMTHSHVWHDSSTRDLRTELLTPLYWFEFDPPFAIKLHMWHDAFIRVTWLVDVCDVNDSYVWQDSFICEKLHMLMGATSLSYLTWLVYMRHDSAYVAVTHLYVTWLSPMCDMTHAYVTLPHMLIGDMIFICDMTHSCVTCFVCL